MAQNATDAAPRDDEPMDVYVTRLNGRLWGLTLGFLFGLGLFVATIVLVLKGGDDVGSHLALLGHYFPFYDVTLAGAFIGFVYAFFVGYVIGRVICLFYNFAARRL